MHVRFILAVPAGLSAGGRFEPGVGHAAEHRAAVAGRAVHLQSRPAALGPGRRGRGAGALPAVFAPLHLHPVFVHRPHGRAAGGRLALLFCAAAPALGVSFAQGAPCARGGPRRAAGPGLSNEGQRPGACARAGALVPFQPALKGARAAGPGPCAGGGAGRRAGHRGLQSVCAGLRPHRLFRLRRAAHAPDPLDHDGPRARRRL